MKKVLFTFTIIILSSSLFAQFGELLRFNSGGLINLQWNMAKPVGSMSDLMTNTSFSGFNIDYRHCYKNNIIIGGRVGLNSFLESRNVITFDVANDISYGNIDYRINAVPIMFIVDYMFSSNKFIPYVGIGVGTYFINSSTVLNNSTTEKNSSFHFGVSPEVGITIPFIISNFGLSLSSRYNYALGAGTSSGYSWFDFNIGISFMY